jgi:hypothetical protein
MTDTAPSFIDCGQKRSSFGSSDVLEFGNLCCGPVAVIMWRCLEATLVCDASYYIRALISDVLTEILDNMIE